MITLLDSEDLDACAEVFFDAFKNPPFNYEWLTIEKSARYIGDLIRSPGALSFKYYREGILTGICVGSVSDYFIEPQYEIKEFAVVPHKQRKGAGTGMLAEIERYLKTERGVRHILLHTSRTIPAYDFYIKNNYSPVKDNVYFVKEI